MSWPAGQTTRSLTLVGPVTVTLRTTALAPPVSGTPFAPVTLRVVTVWPTGPVVPPVPTRVSRMRTPGSAT